MAFDSNQMKKGVLAFIEMVKHADKIQSFIMSQGENADGHGIDYEFLQDLEKVTSRLEKCNWDVKSYFNWVATELTTQDCENDKKAWLTPPGGWQEKVDDAIRTLETL